MQASLFTSETSLPAADGFDVPPSLPAGTPVSFDAETTGLNLRGGARPFAFNIATAWGEWCCAWNEPYLRDLFRNNEVTTLSGKFDIWAADNGGVNLEELGTKVWEVEHAAALLNDRRRRFNLNTLSQDYLNRKKLDLPHGRVWEFPTAMIVPYGRQDARLTYDLRQAMEPEIQAQDLNRVLELENALIYSTLSMQRVGVALDMPKLHLWRQQVRDARDATLIKIWACTGLRVNPDSPTDMKKLCRYLGIDHTGCFTDEGNESFADAALQPFVAEHEAIRHVVMARDLSSWLSKCGDKYAENAVNGMLYYKLHQLRCDEGGTVTGRYSGDMQQVPKPKKQSEATKRWIVRELFVGEDGSEVVDADASQIEYRLFAHYSCVPYPHSTRLIKAYCENPDIDFHDFVTHDILHDIMIRDLAKNVNFAKLYGAQADKIAAMCNISTSEAEVIIADYDRAFPESSRLLNFCTKLAERRNFIRTFMGRKRSYLKGDRFYSALNTVLQGTAAEIMKLKVLLCYNERKTIGGVTRITFHDELVRDKGESYTKKRFAEALAEQAIKLRVPITWEVGSGANWKQAME